MTGTLPTMRPPVTDGLVLDEIRIPSILFHSWSKLAMDSGTQNTDSQLGHLNPKLEPQFQDRRNPSAQRSTPGFERRQFTNSHDDLSPDAAELGRAIDQYKLQNRRRFINYEEMLGIIKSLGYEKQS